MRRMTPLDAAWLTVDSRDTPMHVATLVILSKPKNAAPSYLQDLVDEFQGARSFVPPWNLRIRQSALKNVLPVVEEIHDIDMEYHVRHSALPKPGGERELGVLVSRLHAHQLDLSRPLWECHIIEGLENDRFALYTKMHHALVDGVAGVRIMQRSFSESSRERNMGPPWTRRAATEPKREHQADAALSPTGWATAALTSTRSKARSAAGLGKTVAHMISAAGNRENALTSPYDSPKSVLNKRISPPRRFGTQQYELERLKKICQAANVTLNDVVLCICGAALRRFLLESNALPDKPLTAGIPVSVRPAGDMQVGTAISFILSTLGTDIADPLLRLQAIHASTSKAKNELQALTRKQIDGYTLMLMGPFIGSLVTGLGGRTRPVFNITISNVPGPQKPLYFNGARVDGVYPVSLVTHGQALNITCLSYAGKLNFGFTAARDTLPHMQRLSVYTGEALDELETLLLAKAPTKTGTSRRQKAG